MAVKMIKANELKSYREGEKAILLFALLVLMAVGLLAVGVTFAQFSVLGYFGFGFLLLALSIIKKYAGYTYVVGCGVD